jgi:C1A family cysteine protease
MMSDATARKYGWRPSLPDFRDAGVPDRVVETSLSLPPEVDPREAMPPVYDQGQLGSCTANAIAAAFQFHSQQHYDTEFGVPSRLFIYYMERLREGTVQEDSGAYGRDGFASLRKTGVCREEAWPYDISRFREVPPEAAYEEAAGHKIKGYFHPGLNPRDNREKRLAEMKAALAVLNPIAFGFTVYESFESAAVAENGVVPMPKKDERVLGGHEVLMIGYLKSCPDHALCRNSWGNGWGMDGYFLMPWSLILNPQMASDFRAIEDIVR